MVIHFNTVSKRYIDGHHALTRLSFHIDAGEMVFGTDHSGASKSTLIKLLTLIECPTHGHITLQGKPLTKMHRGAVSRRLRRQLGMVFQEHCLLSDRSVFDNVELPLIIGGMAPMERCRRARAALEKVGLINHEKQYPDLLSAGQKQRASIARAIVTRPPLLIADEPTGNLDPQLAIQIMELFTEFQQIGTTVLIASHDLTLIKRTKWPENGRYSTRQCALAASTTCPSASGKTCRFTVDWSFGRDVITAHLQYSTFGYGQSYRRNNHLDATGCQSDLYPPPLPVQRNLVRPVQRYTGRVVELAARVVVAWTDHATASGIRWRDTCFRPAVRLLLAVPTTTATLGCLGA